MELHPRIVQETSLQTLAMDTPVENRESCSAPRLKEGEICPFCGQGVVDYDGMLILGCPVCGQKETGGWT